MLPLPSLTATFTHLKALYQAVGIQYDKPGWDKTIPGNKDIAPRLVCRKGCTHAFTNYRERADHDKSCSGRALPPTSTPKFTCPHNCGKSWANVHHLNSHLPYCPSRHIDPTPTVVAAVESHMQRSEDTEVVLNEARAAVGNAHARAVERIGKRHQSS